MEQRGLAPHHIREDEFALFARTEPAIGVIELLKRSRQSRALLLIKYLLSNASDLQPAGDLLVEAHHTDPRAVNALLIYPWVAAWALAYVNNPRDLSHRRATNALALAAAARAGVRHKKIAISAVAGKVMVPSLGLLETGSSGQLGLDSLRGRYWQPLRSIDVHAGGLSLSMVIDDLDPYRDCHGVPVAPRLSDDDLASLKMHFADAWSLLVTYSPRRAHELSVGLVSYAPLSFIGLQQSVTCAETFGGLAATHPRDGVELAVTLVHEFHHSKLSALDALYPLTHRDESAKYFAPWRPDPRSLSGLLQGIYAFTAVASLWRDLTASQILRETAVNEFVWMRLQISRALTEVTEDAALTDAGRRLIAGLNSVADEHARFLAPEHVEREAMRRLARAEARWTSRRISSLTLR